MGRDYTYRGAKIQACGKTWVLITSKSCEAVYHVFSPVVWEQSWECSCDYQPSSCYNMGYKAFSIVLTGVQEDAVLSNFAGTVLIFIFVNCKIKDLHKSHFWEQGYFGIFCLGIQQKVDVLSRISFLFTVHSVLIVFLVCHFLFLGWYWVMREYIVMKKSQTSA